MHRSKLFSTLSKLPTVLFCSFLTITALTTVPQLTGQNKAVAQANNSKPTVPNSVENAEKKCTDKDVLALYKAVDELNIRVSVGINYIDFSRYSTDLVILKSRLVKSDKCSKTIRILKDITDGYNIIRNLWRHRINGAVFIPVNDTLVTQLGDLTNGLTRYFDGTEIGIQSLERLYIQENIKDFDKLKHLI